MAQYTLALSALCQDPRQFHGHDLIGTIQHHEPPHDLDFAYAALAACTARAHVRKKQIRRLLDIANTAKDHNIGKWDDCALIFPVFCTLITFYTIFVLLISPPKHEIKQ